MSAKKLTLTASLAAALAGLSGCGSSDDDDWGTRASANTRICVDNAGQRIADQYCRSGYGGGGSFFYLARGARIPYYYDSVRDPRYARYGSYSPGPGAYAPAPASTNMARSTAVSRGGLGRSGRSFGRGG